MEFAITAIIIGAAAVIVVRRWVQSTKRSLSSAASGACTGDCVGCTATAELHLNDYVPTACHDNRQKESASTGGRQETKDHAHP